MDFSDFIGLVITILAMVWMIINWGKRQPALPEEEQQKELQEFMRALRGEEESPPPAAPIRPPPPPQRIKHPPPLKAAPAAPKRDPYKFENDVGLYESTGGVQARKLETAIEKRRLTPALEKHELASADWGGLAARLDTEPYDMNKGPSRVSQLIESVPSKRTLIIFHDLLEPPKGL